MFATDFLFNGHLASDFELLVCSFGDSETASGGEIEYNVVKAPNRDRFTFYGSQFNTPLTWNFSLIKNPCENNNLYFNEYEEDKIAEWLIKDDGYRWFKFEQEGYDEVWYKVTIGMTPHQISGRTIGFDLTVTSDCGYGFSQLITKRFSITTTTPFKFYVHSFIPTYIYPYVTIKGEGDFYINNENDKMQNRDNAKETRFNNVSKEITIDSDSEIISGIKSANDDFNWYFPRLVKGYNTLSTNSEKNIELTVKYREPRRVII